MLTYVRTSLFDSRAQTLVNTVNCVGVMGKGLAKEFKSRTPEMFAEYRRICDDRLLKPGKLWLWKRSTPWILNFPTKDHWRAPARLEWVEQGLKRFCETYAEKGIESIAFPRLGCGNGGLDWEHVRPLMESYLSALSIPVYIHDHEVDIGLPEHLEEASRMVKEQFANLDSFDRFYSAIERLLDLTNGKFEEIKSGRKFSAHRRSDGICVGT